MLLAVGLLLPLIWDQRGGGGMKLEPGPPPPSPRSIEHHPPSSSLSSVAPPLFPAAYATPAYAVCPPVLRQFVTPRAAAGRSDRPCVFRRSTCRGPSLPTSLPPQYTARHTHSNVPNIYFSRKTEPPSSAEEGGGVSVLEADAKGPYTAHIHTAN